MATASPPTGQPSVQPIPFGMRLQNFWRRVTEGLEVSQLWSQFESEARASYRLYSKDVAAKTPEGLTTRGHHLHVIKEFFWAVFEKLSPARRVLLLVALILLVVPHGAFEYAGQGGKVYAAEFDSHFWAALLLLLLLMLEIADRVVMKRDLQIAREIQTWLLPGVPPQIPGLAISYATRPANTVAGDYYDVFPRPGKTNRRQSRCARRCGRRRQEHSRCDAHGYVPGQPENAFHGAGGPARTCRQHEPLRLQQQPGWIAFHDRVSRGVRSDSSHSELHQRRSQQPYPATR